MTKGKELPPSSRERSPCFGCTERFLACSDHCPKDERGEFGYLAWKAAVKKIEDTRKEYYEQRRLQWERVTSCRDKE